MTPVYLAYPDRLVVVTSLEQAQKHLLNGWPRHAKEGKGHAYAHALNACRLGARGIYDANKARTLFVKAAREAGL